MKEVKEDEEELRAKGLLTEVEGGGQEEEEEEAKGGTGALLSLSFRPKWARC